jgi:hypothetical protein
VKREATTPEHLEPRSDEGAEIDAATGTTLGELEASGTTLGELAATSFKLGGKQLPQKG